MKKIILSIAMIASISFLGCSDDDEKTCKSCDDVADLGIDFEVCDNGDGTATFTASASGIEIFSETEDIPDGESIDDIDCSDLTDVDIDFSALAKENGL